MLLSGGREAVQHPGGDEGLIDVPCDAYRGDNEPRLTAPPLLPNTWCHLPL